MSTLVSPLTSSLNFFTSACDVMAATARTGAGRGGLQIRVNLPDASKAPIAEMRHSLCGFAGAVGLGAIGQPFGAAMRRIEHAKKQIAHTTGSPKPSTFPYAALMASSWACVI